MKNYNTYTLIDYNPNNLNLKNLAPLGELDFKNEVQEGEITDLGYYHQDRLVAILYYKVIKIEKTEKVDKIILLYLSRDDYPQLNEVTRIVEIRQRLALLQRIRTST